MWHLIPRFKPALKDDLNGFKTVKVNGHKFKIRKINPFLDFASDKIPQIFTAFVKRRKIEPDQEMTPENIKRGMDDMKMIVLAGVVEPKICPEIITIDELFRWGDTGSKLYLEILAHSLNQFRGIKGVFFSIATRRSLYSAWRKSLVALQSN